MLNFIMMTISFTVAILLVMVLSFVVMMSPKVMKGYMKLIAKYMKNMEKIAEEEFAKDL